LVFLSLFITDPVEGVALEDASGGFITDEISRLPGMRAERFATILGPAARTFRANPPGTLRERYLIVMIGSGFSESA